MYLRHVQRRHGCHSFRGSRLAIVALCAAAGLVAGRSAFAVTFTRILDPANPVVNDLAESGGACWIDLQDNGDGLLDLYVANGNLTNQDDALYVNTGTGFVKVVTGPVVHDGGSSIGGTWGDYDADGRADLFVTNRNNFGNFLYHAESETTFTKITTGEIVTDIGNSNSSSWTDLDGNGRLDMYVVNFGGPDFAYLNGGPPSFGFTGVDTLSPGQGNANSIPGAWADYDNDRDQDLFIGIAGNANDRLYRNDGGLRFTEIQFGDGRPTLGASWGDCDNDGDLDLFTPIFMNQGNMFYRNSGAPGFDLVPVDTVLPANAGNSVGSGWGDFDNDGDLDLFVANDGQNNMLFENGGPPSYTFTRITTGAIVTDGGNSFGAVWGDYDGDGDLDLFVANRLNQANFLYRNDGTTNHWLKVRLAGITSNRSAIGAKVRVLATIGGVPRWQTREVVAQTGYNSQNLEIHFGLGGATIADSVRVEWPSGETDRLHGIGVDRVLRIVEGQGPVGIAPALAPPGPALGLWQLGTGDPIVQFQLPRAAMVQLALYTIAGRRVATLFEGRRAAGLHTERLELAAAEPRSVYLCRLLADRETRAIKLLVLR
jgi:hypothetical protein